ncbi:uncharacterized protein B0T15DRAFT_542902 [Chaetomium strumarium]|uniref:Uncharacterized protein n=1 Tax=Chaetomium strumarium TaxID=1170767 RepID=A0AAJ0GM33_9PEZI|nr:hypothetical protein B0T15DRAFT_542902 [Chaetomium strumarium]
MHCTHVLSVAVLSDRSPLASHDSRFMLTRPCDTQHSAARESHNTTTWIEFIVSERISSKGFSAGSRQEPPVQRPSSGVALTCSPSWPEPTIIAGGSDENSDRRIWICLLMRPSRFDINGTNTLAHLTALHQSRLPDKRANQAMNLPHTYNELGWITITPSLLPTTMQSLALAACCQISVLRLKASDCINSPLPLLLTGC